MATIDQMKPGDLIKLTYLDCSHWAERVRGKSFYGICVSPTNVFYLKSENNPELLVDYDGCFFINELQSSKTILKIVN